MEFIAGLASNPERKGDFTDCDAKMREREVKIIGEYAVTYWLDAPVKAVMIVDVRRADG